MSSRATASWEEACLRWPPPCEPAASPRWRRTGLPLSPSPLATAGSARSPQRTQCHWARAASDERSCCRRPGNRRRPAPGKPLRGEIRDGMDPDDPRQTRQVPFPSSILLVSPISQPSPKGGSRALPSPRGQAVGRSGRDEGQGQIPRRSAACKVVHLRLRFALGFPRSPRLLPSRLRFAQLTPPQDCRPGRRQ